MTKASSTRAQKKPDTTSSTLSKDINPNHYVIEVDDVEGRPVKIEVVDLIEVLCPNDAHIAHAFTYLLRAGRKAASSYVKDVLKCAWWCIRAANFHGAKIDLQHEFTSATHVQRKD